MNGRRSFFVLTMMAFGFAFLYIPILSLIVYSFNESRLVTVWAGFSTKWYVELFQNQQVIDAAKLSFEIAAINATVSTVLGTLVGLALARFGRFRGRALLTANLQFSAIVFASILGVLVFADHIPLAGWLGMAVIIASGLLATWAAQRRTRARLSTPLTVSPP